MTDIRPLADGHPSQGCVRGPKARDDAERVVRAGQTHRWRRRPGTEGRTLR